MNQKKKLLIFYRYLSPYRMDTYNALAKAFETHVVLTAGNEELATLGYDLETVNRQAEFTYHYHTKGLRLGGHPISSMYYRVIKNFKPDIILACELGVNVLFAIFLRPFFKYRLYTFVDDSPKMTTEYYKGLRKILRKFVIRRTDGFIVVNPQVRDYYTQNFKNSRAQHYYLPIIYDEKTLAEKYKKALPLSQQISENYNLNGKKIVIFVGRLEKIKAIDLLLRVFKELHQTNPDIRLAIIGSGMLECELKNYVASNKLDDAVFFPGLLTGNDLYAWYNAGQVLALPSYFERFGAVVNEALVAGCRVVVSDSIGATCLVNDNNGKIFETNNYDSLKNALSETLDKIDAIDKIILKNSLMNEFFSDTIQEFANFISS